MHRRGRMGAICRRGESCICWECRNESIWCSAVCRKGVMRYGTSQKDDAIGLVAKRGAVELVAKKSGGHRGIVAMV